YDCDEQYANPNDVSKTYKNYFELINGAEWSIDTILQYLQSKNLLDSTLIIFTSDNGLLMGEHQLGGKEIALEPSIKLPMFIRYPKWFSPGTVINDEMAMNIDIAPTILDAAGIANIYNMDGMSMRELANGTKHRKELFYEFFYRLNCNPTFQAVRDFNYKYIQNQCSSFSEEFYDLLSDPLENSNLIFDEDYESLVALYKNKLDSLKDYYGFVNISNTTLNCSLENIDSSGIVFKPASGSNVIGSFELYPNPVTDRISLIIGPAKYESILVSIRNIFAQPVYETELSASAHQSVYYIDVSYFLPGTYFADIIYQGKHDPLVFIKQ